MEELAEKLSKYIFKNSFITLDELKNISFILDCYFRDKIYQGIVESQKNIYIMSYDFDTITIKVVYESLKKRIIEIYNENDFYRYLKNVAYFNISIIIFLFHEFRHSMQAYEMQKKSLLGSLYQKSRDFISKKGEYAMFYRAIYNKYHEHFSIEINANYMAYLWIIEVLELLDFDDRDFYKELLINKLQYEYFF